MNTTILMIMLALGIVGHAINMWCDRVLSVYPNGRITLDTADVTKDESRIAALMKGANLDNLLKSGVYGVSAIFLHFLGYAAIAAYVYQYQQILGEILFLSAAMFGILGAGHHIKYALSAWVFVRSDYDHRGFQMFQEIYNNLPITKLCYVGYLLYVAVLIAAILMGVTPMPIWMVIFTVLPIFIAMLPFKIIGTLHISAMATFAGWLVMILVMG